MLRVHSSVLSVVFYSIGTGGIDKPVYNNHTRSDDGKFITHSWGHITEAIVSHYNLTLTFMTSEDGGQVLKYNVTITSIIIPSTSIDLNGTLSAVSVCGDESEPVSFQGTYNNSNLSYQHNLHNMKRLCYSLRCFEVNLIIVSSWLAA